MIKSPVLFNKTLVIGIIILLIGISINPSTGIKVEKKPTTPSFNGNILYVGGSGPGNYTSIQAAIDDANDGDTVFVYYGFYEEPYVLVVKSINLFSIGGRPYINPEDTPVSISAPWVNMSGFHIDAMDKWSHGLDINSHHNNISHIDSYSTIGGLSVSGSYNTVTEVSVYVSDPLHLYESEVGMAVYGSHHYISNCVAGVGEEGQGGLYFCGNNIFFSKNSIGIDDEDSEYTAFMSGYNNIITNNGIGGHSQMILSDFNNNHFCYNHIVKCGMLIKGESINNHIYQNIIEKADIGIEMHGENNSIYYNKFINNVQNAYDDGTNTWYNVTLKQGNYWDDFDETDEGAWDNDSDGIVDTPYNIPGGSNQDLYPLLSPYGPPNARFIYTRNDKNVIFNSTSYDYNGNITSNNWDFGDNNTGTGKTVNHTYAKYGAYNISLTVTDNDGKTDYVVKTIGVENVPPEIIDNTPGIGYTGDLFMFNSTIMDNSQVYKAWVEYWYGTGPHTNMSMNNIADNTWKKIITIKDTIETMHYVIATQDIALNWNDTGVKDVTIYDNDKPELSIVKAEPSVQMGGGNVNVSATIVDNIEIDEVYLNIVHPDSSSENFSITQNKTGDTYYCNRTYYRVGTFKYNIWTNDTSGNQNVSEDYNFKILNQRPYKPDNPIPEDNAVEVPISELTLSWSGGDINIGDVLQYYMYFGNNTNPSCVGIIPDVPYNQDIIEFPIYAIYDLEYSTKYYWKIKAEDNHGDSIDGEIWSFTTSEVPVPDLECDGNLNWGSMPPGGTITGYFTVENNGEPTSLLDWEISEYPEWGSDWTFAPASGSDLIPEDGPETVGMSFVAPDESNKEFNGTVKVVNSENPDDYEIIDVILSTPRNRATYSFLFRLLFERFPLLERLLSLLL